MALPKILIQGWVGSSPMPDRELKFCADMKAMNKDFEYLFLDNGFLNRHQRDPYIHHMVSRGEKWAFVMDRLRVLALKEHGGIWIDPDAMPVKPLNTLEVWKDDRWDFLTAHRSPYRSEVQVKRGVAVVDNSFMGSAKNGRVVNHLVNLSDSRNPVRKGASYGWEIMEKSGPDVCWLSPKEFYSMDPHPNAVVLHDGHNLASWCDNRPMRFANAEIQRH